MKQARNGRIPSVAAEAAVRTAAVPSTKSTIELSNGIVLGVKAVPQQLIRNAQKAVPEPVPPMWHNEQREVDEPNFADPDYLKAMEKYTEDCNEASGKVALLMGTFAVSVPPGMFMPADDGWMEWLEVAGSTPNLSNSAYRYLDWLDLYALASREDRSVAMYAPLIASSLGEQEVDAAVDSFRNIMRGRTNPASSSEVPDGDGDQLPSALSGDRAGDGGEGSGDLQRGDVAIVAGDVAREQD